MITETKSRTRSRLPKTTYCATFNAWRGGDDKALDHLLNQGYDRLFMPKAERVAASSLHPSARQLLDKAWYNVATIDERESLGSFSQFLLHLQAELERVGSMQASK